MKKFIIILLLFSFTQLYAQEVNKAEKDGIAVQIGTGTMFFGGIGGLVENQILLKNSYRITPYVGFGFSKGGTDSTIADYNWLGWNVGISIEYGIKHRIIFGPQLFGAYNIYNKPENASLTKKLINGPSCIIGYKGTASFGLIWQIAAGITYIQDPYATNNKFYYEPHIGGGLGYKF